MKTKTTRPMRALIFAASCAILAVGCCHTHSLYRSIHQAAINGDATAVAADLRARPTDLDLPDDEGETPLHLAAIHCHPTVAALLLDKGANVEARARGGATPLHLAAQVGCAAMVKLLLARGARVNPRDNQGRTPLVRAEEWHQTAIAQLLRQHGGTE